MTVCVDASVVLKWLTFEDGSDRALSWLNARANDEIVAPAFLPVEVASVLRQKMCRGEMTVDECFEALHLLNRLEIRYVWDSALVERAFKIAVETGQPTVYDTTYLALAEKEQCEMWTADARFVHAASPRYPFVRLI